MKIIRNSSEDEMLLEYLKSEINSKRFGERLKKTLNELNISKDILLNGNLELKEVKELGIYDYKSKEESNLFSPLLWINGVNKGIKIAKALSERGIINSTGTFGLIPANNRESIKKYCSTLNMYDKIYAINSENLLNNIIAVTLMEDYDKEKLDEIVKNIKELLK